MKSEIIQTYIDAGFSRADAIKAVELIGPTLLKVAAANPGGARLNGFGVFSFKTRKATQGRNPRTGEVMDLPESRYFSFKAARSTKAYK